jgi:glyoxylase-like metal-dependent hydrolase (beta-lactamase superfamily II)
MREDAYTLILAPNASLMTGAGTNTIVLGGGVEGASVIDPADDDPHHLEAIVAAGKSRGGIRRILITHGHHDHFGGAEALSRLLTINIYGFSCAGLPIVDEELPDGMILPAGNDRLRAIHTPGHRHDHLCFYLERQQILFAGDLVAGTGTIVIAPPEGDMQAYLRSLERLAQLPIREIVPAHGPIITDPQTRIAEYIAHRLEREKQVMQILRQYPQGLLIPMLVQQIYTDVDPQLHAAAALSVEAHLHKLEREGRVSHAEDNLWHYRYVDCGDK